MKPFLASHNPVRHQQLPTPPRPSCRIALRTHARPNSDGPPNESARFRQVATRRVSGPLPASRPIPPASHGFSPLDRRLPALHRSRARFRTMPRKPYLLVTVFSTRPPAPGPRRKASPKSRPQAQASGEPSAGGPAAHPDARRSLAVARSFERQPTGFRAGGSSPVHSLDSGPKRPALLSPMQLRFEAVAGLTESNSVDRSSRRCSNEPSWWAWTEAGNRTKE